MSFSKFKVTDNQQEPKKSYSEALGESKNTNRSDRSIKVDNSMKKSNKTIATKKVDRFRTYPCQNFVSTGGCPYHERCTFLHDPRIKSDRDVSRLNAKKLSEPKDTFYWPDMDISCIKSDTVTSNYEIPKGFAEDAKNQHDCSIFSIW